MSTPNPARLLAGIDIPQRSRSGSFEILLDLVADVAPGRALDAPSGPGRLSEALHRLGHRVTAADLDDAFEPRHLPFVRLDLDRALPFADAVFDLVVCGDGVEHLENPFALFRELARVLADGGALVIATPNYLNLERRLNFLWSGSLTKPLARGAAPGDKSERGHISPLTLIRMAYIAEGVGLELVRSVGALPKRRQYWLLPLALGIRCVRPFLSDRWERDLFAEHTLTLRALLGGKKVMALFRKVAPPARSGPVPSR